MPAMRLISRTLRPVGGVDRLAVAVGEMDDAGAPLPEIAHRPRREAGEQQQRRAPVIRLSAIT